MKYTKLLLSFLLTIGIFFVLNTKLGDIPPLGKFLNPQSGIWQNEIDEAKNELMDQQREIMWSTLFEAKDNTIKDWILENYEKTITEAGFTIIDLSKEMKEKIGNETIIEKLSKIKNKLLSLKKDL